jgi:outer membrane immunogenic protein
MKNTLAFLLTFAAATIASAQQSAQPPAGDFRLQAAFTYTWAHSNAPVAGCGCFSLNGGSFQLQAPAHAPGLSGVFDLTAATQSNVDSTAKPLTLTIFTGGVRWRPARGVWQYYGQALVGGGYASGSFAQQSVGSSSSWSFATNIGGGLERRLAPRWSLRIFEADYMLTRFNNQKNNIQNNLRLSGGVAVHF